MKTIIQTLIKWWNVPSYLHNVVILVHAINVTDMIIVQSVSGRVEVVVSSSFNVPHTPSEYL